MATRAELKALQKVWYAKLRAEGFNDIEQKTGTHRHDSDHFAHKRVVARFEATQAYFYNATQFLNDYKFESEYDRAVWEYHSNGLSSREIANTLKKAGLRSNYDKVQIITRRLKKIMNQG